jgi:bisphosphoglycerate-dependent phosphoglycerate mutase
LERNYKELIAKEKTKIRYNFSENAKRTWKRLKQTTGQATKIEPEEFRSHYSKNWEEASEDINVEDCSNFLMQSKLVFVESEMIKELINKDKMKRAITMKANFSAPGLDKLTYPILKYEKEDAAEMMVKIMEMVTRLQK